MPTLEEQRDVRVANLMGHIHEMRHLTDEEIQGAADFVGADLWQEYFAAVREYAKRIEAVYVTEPWNGG